MLLHENRFREHINQLRTTLDKTLSTDHINSRRHHAQLPDAAVIETADKMPLRPNWQNRAGILRKHSRRHNRVGASGANGRGSPK